MVELKHVGVISTGKFFAVLAFFFNLIIVLMILAFSSIFPAGVNYLSQNYLVLMVIQVVLAPLSGFGSGALMAIVYNVIASVIGGVDVTFTKKEAPGALPAQATRRAAVAGAAADAGAAKSSGVATAVNAELLNYVKGELAAGRPKEEVVAELVKAGWTQDDIHAALNAAVLG